ncbi:MAG: HNH endonuclease [Mycobacterium sp.]|nr:HNH endonuclease [Mycobacterium sp.]
MFDTFDDSTLVAAMSAAQRDERTACARRILLAGRLVLRRMSGVEADDRTQWCIDNWEAVAAEVGAELGISRGRASSQMNYGVELLERLPKLGAAFAAGKIEFRVIVAAVFRTGLITDPDILARIDGTLACSAPRWNEKSQKRLTQLIDHWVASLDPAAVRVASNAEQDRHIEFGDPHDGMVEFWGSLRTPDAATLERTLDQLADSVCPTDPRTKEQRRADALLGLAGAAPALPCECEQPDCAAAEAPTPSPVVIHVIAEKSSLDGAGDTPGHLPGYGSIPPAMLRELAQRAILRPLDPSALSCPQSRYRPSAALAEFIRCRDLHCRFPGCDRPAEYCDIDHTVPWQAGGPTHPSNLNLRCRAHHLLKTFWVGENRWAEKQYANGTIVFTAPSGRTYTTKPGGALFFPQLAATTGEIILENREPSSGTDRTLMMPTRRRTRADERSARTRWERGLNEARWAADPPPF